MKNTSIVVGVLLLFVLSVTVAHAAELVVFPAKGQSEKQMDTDKGSCSTWAKKETGVDPVAIAQQSTSQPAPTGPQGERVRGAARGAAAGAVVGAVAGDAGKGAAVGATAGVVAGGAKQRRTASAQQSAQQQTQAQMQQDLDKYNRAYAACLEGKGYTVK